MQGVMFLLAVGYICADVTKDMVCFHGIKGVLPIHVQLGRLIRHELHWDLDH